MSLINAGLTYECGFILDICDCIFPKYFKLPAPVFIIVASKTFGLRDWSSFSIVYCIASFCLFKIFREL